MAALSDGLSTSPEHPVELELSHVSPPGAGAPPTAGPLPISLTVLDCVMPATLTRSVLLYAASCDIITASIPILKAAFDATVQRAYPWLLSELARDGAEWLLRTPKHARGTPALLTQRWVGRRVVDAFATPSREGCRRRSGCGCAFLAAPSAHPKARDPLLQAYLTILDDGLAIGLASHHWAFDGHAHAQFLSDWAVFASKSTAEASSAAPRQLPSELSLRDVCIPSVGIPEHLAAAHPELHLLASRSKASDSAAPQLLGREESATKTSSRPSTGGSPAASAPDTYRGRREPVVTRYFHIAADVLEKLQRQLAASARVDDFARGDAAAAPRQVVRPHFSRNDVLSALIWFCVLRARLSCGLVDIATTARCGFAVDIRQRCEPALAARYSGNATLFALASAQVGELLRAAECAAATPRTSLVVQSGADARLVTEGGAAADPMYQSNRSVDGATAVATLLAAAADRIRTANKAVDAAHIRTAMDLLNCCRATGTGVHAAFFARGEPEGGCSHSASVSSLAVTNWSKLEAFAAADFGFGSPAGVLVPCGDTDGLIIILPAPDGGVQLHVQLLRSAMLELEADTIWAEVCMGKRGPG